MFIETRQKPNQLRQERHGSFKNHTQVYNLMPLLTELYHGWLYTINRSLLVELFSPQNAGNLHGCVFTVKVQNHRRLLLVRAQRKATVRKSAL